MFVVGAGIRLFSQLNTIMNFTSLFNDIILEKKVVSKTEIQQDLEKFINHLKTKNNVLFVTTSNRWVGSEQKAKSTHGRCLSSFMREVMVGV